jgi:cell division protein FtsQ
MKNEVQEKKKRRKKKHYLLRFILILLVGIGGYFFMTSHIFDIAKVEVLGQNHYSAEEVILIANIEGSTNLFQLDKKDRIALMKQDPYIKEVTLRRKLPETLLVEIIERTEDAGIAYGDSYVLIHRDGMVLGRVDQQPEIPILMGMTIINMQAGEILEVEEGTVLENTLLLLDTMEARNLFFKKIDISNVVIKAYIYDKLICQGRPEDIMEAMENGNLEAVLLDLLGEGIQHGTIHLGGGGYCSFSPLVP